MCREPRPLSSLVPSPLGCRSHPGPMPPGTHILIRRLVGADQVRVEPGEPDDGPDGEEAHHGLQHGDRESRKQTGRAGSALRPLGSRADVRLGQETPQAAPPRPLAPSPLVSPTRDFRGHLTVSLAQPETFGVSPMSRLPPAWHAHSPNESWAPCT